MTARRSIWTWRTCTALAAGTAATIIAAAAGLLTFLQLIGVDWEAIPNLVGERGP